MKTNLPVDLTVLSSHRRSQTTLGTRENPLTLLLLFTFAAAGFAADDFFGSPATQKGVAPATPVPANPVAAGADLDAYRTQYSQSLAALRAEREAKYARVRASYVAALERLQKDVTTRGDLDGALAVKAEHDRIAAAQEPNADERKAMPPAVAAVRTRYEQELQPILAENARQEEALGKRYAVALQELQMRYTQRNELEKALAVKADLTALAATGSAPPVAPPGGGTPKELIRSAPSLADSKWKIGDEGKVVALHADGSSSISWSGRKGSWKVIGPRELLRNIWNSPKSEKAKINEECTEIRWPAGTKMTRINP